MTPGRFITIEGIEGAGKSTVANALVAALLARGQPAVLTREPGGTPLAEQLRTLVLRRDAERVSPEVETLLMFAARGLHLDNLIRPALSSGQWVVCDRFTDATRAYQGAGRQVSAALIETLAAAVQGDLQPDLTLLLDLPAAAGLRRARSRNREPGGAGDDRIEAESLAFFERVRAGYLRVAAQAPRRVRVLDATQPPPVVLHDAISALDAIK